MSLSEAPTPTELSAEELADHAEGLAGNEAGPVLPRPPFSLLKSLSFSPDQSPLKITAQFGVPEGLDLEHSAIASEMMVLDAAWQAVGWGLGEMMNQIPKKKKSNKIGRAMSSGKIDFPRKIDLNDLKGATAEWTFSDSVKKVDSKGSAGFVLKSASGEVLMEIQAAEVWVLPDRIIKKMRGEFDPETWQKENLEIPTNYQYPTLAERGTLAEDRTTWTVKVDPKDPIFALHFKDDPVQPGVIGVGYCLEAATAFAESKGIKNARVLSVGSIKFSNQIFPNAGEVQVQFIPDEDSSPNDPVQKGSAQIMLKGAVIYEVQDIVVGQSDAVAQAVDEQSASIKDLKRYGFWS